MLQPGNSKLGSNIYQFSIPAGGNICPGKSETCDSSCYAQKGFYSMPSVQGSLKKNYKASKRQTFVDNMLREIDKIKPNIVRIHVAGDFYDAAYIRKWKRIISATPNVIYFAYTRSWRITELRKELEKLAKLKNLRLWWSIDNEIVAELKKLKVPPRVKCAYMSVSLQDIPNSKMNLVFRDYPVRNTQQKYMNGIFVCPPENGITDLTCTECGVCYSTKKPPKRKSEFVNGRMPLEVIKR